MTPTPEDHEKLERLVHRALRELPALRAPRSLEQRVQAEIVRRAALPWWRQGFAHWPLPARAAFFLVSAAVAAMVLVATTRMAGSLETAAWPESVAQPLGWLEGALAVVSSIGGFFEIVLRSVPPLWLYGGLAFCATMYAALFGLGAAAYRTFHAHQKFSTQ